MTPPLSSPLLPETPATPVSRVQRILAYRWLIFLAIFVFTADQVSKYAISHSIPLGTNTAPPGYAVIPGFFNIIHVGNFGAAWSMFTGYSTILALLAVATLSAIYYWRRALGIRQFAMQICFGLLCGGIAGNLLDRIVHGYVIDFLDFHTSSYYFPTFNVADSGICVGVFTYIWFVFRTPTPSK